MPTNLVVVEDDQPLKEFLSGWLKDEGFLVQSTDRGAPALNLIETTGPDLVILDLGLPDLSGEDVLKKIKATQPGLPVIILTAKNKINDIAAGLNLGADDYLAKPFAAEELLARIRARLRPSGNHQSVLRLHDLIIDTDSRQVSRNKQKINLTKTEYELLVYLAKQPGKVFSRETILNHVWGYDKDVESRVVDVYIGYLRQKIDRHFSPKLISNHRGVGYSLMR